MGRSCPEDVFRSGQGKLISSCTDCQKKHLVLTSAHPSPLAASRGFFGNGHFKKANDWLEERYGPGGGVDWTSLSKE